MGPSSTATHVGRTTTHGHRSDGLPRGPQRDIGDQGADVGTPSPPVEPPRRGSSRLTYRVAGRGRAGVDCASGRGGSQAATVKVAATTHVLNVAVARSALRGATVVDAVAWLGSADPAIARPCDGWPSAPVPPLPPEAEPALPACWDQWSGDPRAPAVDSPRPRDHAPHRNAPDRAAQVEGA